MRRMSASFPGGVHKSKIDRKSRTVVGSIRESDRLLIMTIGQLDFIQKNRKLPVQTKYDKSVANFGVQQAVPGVATRRRRRIPREARAMCSTQSSMLTEVQVLQPLTPIFCAGTYRHWKKRIVLKKQSSRMTMTDQALTPVLPSGRSTAARSLNFCHE